MLCDSCQAQADGKKVENHDRHDFVSLFFQKVPVAVVEREAQQVQVDHNGKGLRDVVFNMLALLYCIYHIK